MEFSSGELQLILNLIQSAWGNGAIRSPEQANMVNRLTKRVGDELELKKLEAPGGSTDGRSRLAAQP